MQRCLPVAMRQARPCGGIAVPSRYRWSLPRSPLWVGIRPRTPCLAGNENSDAVQSMTEEEARRVLELQSTATFDDVVGAKNRLLAGAVEDKEKEKEIEAAYDFLLMSSMRKRVTGPDEVPASVRFADVRRPNPAKKAQKFLSELPNGGLSVEAPTANVLLTNSLVFVPLVSWALLQGLLLPSDFPGDIVPGIPIAIGAIWTLYSLREYKILPLGKAAGYTFASLLFGVLVGGLIEGFVRVDLHPLGVLHSPATLVGEFALLSLWASTIFLV